MPIDAHKNLADSTVSVAPSPAISGVTMTLTAVAGLTWPAVPFDLFVTPPNTRPAVGNTEIVRVTGMSGGNVVTAMTRGSQGTTAQSIAVGWIAHAGPSAKWFTDIETKLSDIHLDVVLDGGADPLGSTDATSIIQAAIDTVAAAGGGVVYLPKGKYKVSSTITFNTGPTAGWSFVTLRGAGRGETTQVMTNSATVDVFNVNASGVTIENMRISAGTGTPIAQSSSLRTAGYAINMANVSAASNCDFRNLDILFQWSGIKASGELCRIVNCNILQGGANAANGQGILNDTFTNTFINSVVMDNPTNPTGYAGVRITNLSSLIMSDCQVIHCGNCLDVVPTGTNTIPSIFAVNCFFDNGVIGANFVGAVGSTISRCKFVQCWFSTHTTAGIRLNNALLKAVDFTGCDIHQSPFGIDAVSAIDWSVRASRLGGNTTNAIRTTAGATHSFTVSDNMIGDTSGFGANAQGVNVQAGTYKRYQVLDNRGFESNTTPGIIDLGAVSATDQKRVDNNMGAVMSGVLSAIIAPVTPPAAATLISNARIPANAVSPGQVFRVHIAGVRTAATTTIFSVRIGTVGTVAGDATVLATAATTAAGAINGWDIVTALITVRSIAAGVATLVGSISGWNQTVTIGQVAAAVTTPTVTVSGPWFIDAVMQPSVASAFTVHQCVIEAV